MAKCFDKALKKAREEFFLSFVLNYTQFRTHSRAYGVIGIRLLKAFPDAFGYANFVPVYGVVVWASQKLFDSVWFGARLVRIDRFFESGDGTHWQVALLIIKEEQHVLDVRVYTAYSDMKAFICVGSYKFKGVDVRVWHMVLQDKVETVRS